MTGRRIIPRLAAVGVLVLALAGCVRFQADLTVAPANTVDGTIIVAVLSTEDTDEGRAQARENADGVATGLLGTLKDADGVAVADYASDDDYVGYELRLTAVPFEAFSGNDPDSLRFERDGDEIVFTGALDFTEQSSDMNSDSDDGSDLTVSITFPGTVIDHNGELSGTTVSWSTPIKARVEMSARSEAGGAVAAGNLLPLILGIAGVVLLAVVALVVVLALRGRPKAAVAAPAGAAPVAEEPPAG